MKDDSLKNTIAAPKTEPVNEILLRKGISKGNPAYFDRTHYKRSILVCDESNRRSVNREAGHPLGAKLRKPADFNLVAALLIRSSAPLTD